MNLTSAVSTVLDGCAQAWTDWGAAARTVNLQRLSYEREKNIASVLQKSLLERPADGAFEGLDFHTVYAPALAEADVGGDFYDAFPLPDGRIALIVGDISGKGLASASHVARMKYTLRAYLDQTGDLGWSLARLNADLCKSTDVLQPDKLCCVAVIAIDTKTGVLETVMAGMEPAVILRKDGSTQMLDRMPAPALNVAPQSRFSSANYVLHAGDLLLAFTDGFTEARSKTHTFLGYEGLLEIMQQAHRENNLLKNIGGHILASVRQFAAGALHDDACLLLAQLT